MFQHISKVSQVNYGGVQHDMRTYKVNKSNIGRRVSARWNHSTGIMEIKAIKGDGRKPDFQEFDRKEVYMEQPDWEETGRIANDMAEAAWG